MAITFQQAPTVEAGDAITSTQLALLADAFNDRILSGVGDGAWRIHWLAEAFTRQIRNPADANTFPDEDEFLAIYQFLNPGQAEWPAAGPGAPEGANLAAPLNYWRYGIAVQNWDSEPTRVNSVPTTGLSTSLEAAWDQAKLQRGAYDPNSGAYGSPMVELARQATDTFRPLLTGFGNRHDVGYGGYFRYDYGGGGPYAFAVRPSASDVFSVRRMMSWAAQDYRGSGNQMAQAGYHLQNAFDFERFFLNQYDLSPQLGEENLQTGQVTAIYPKWRLEDARQAGTWLVLDPPYSGALRNWTEGFALTGFKFTSTRPVVLDVVTDLPPEDDPQGVPIRTVLTTVEVDGSLVWYLPVALGNPRDVGVLLRTDILAGDIVTAEATELQTRLPDERDAYALLRVCSARSDQTPDGDGTRFDDAKEVSDFYFENRCAANPSGAPGAVDEDAMNVSGPYDSIRKRFKEWVRVVRRDMFTGYEVDGNGDTVLWFKRDFTLPITGGGSATIDPWDGIADAINASPTNGEFSNEWVIETEFRVHDDNQSSPFKTEALADYAAVFDRCMFDSFRVTQNADLNRMVNLTQSQSVLPNNPPGWRYASIGALNVNDKDCSGFPPGPDFDACIEARQQHFKSCRIYEPPMRIKSAETVGSELKVTLHGRMHKADGAPAGPIPRTIDAAATTALRAEPYRSLENGLREYMVNISQGLDCTHPTAFGGTPMGNGATDAGVWVSSSVKGACYPRFRLVKLIPKPVEDANDVQDPTDSRFVHDQFTQMEFYLRAMCEGFVDSSLSKQDSCDDGQFKVYDYTYEALCQQAFGWLRIQVGQVTNAGWGPWPNTRAVAWVFNQFSSAVNLLTRVRVMLPLRLECDYAVEHQNLLVPKASDGASGVIEHTAPGGYPIGEGAFSGDWDQCTGITAERVWRSYDGSNMELTTTYAKVRLALTDDSELAVPETWGTSVQDLLEVLVKVTTNVTQVTALQSTNDPNGENVPQCSGQPIPYGSGYLEEVVEQTVSEDCEFFGGEKLLVPGSSLAGAKTWNYQNVCFGDALALTTFGVEGTPTAVASFALDPVP